MIRTDMIGADKLSRELDVAADRTRDMSGAHQRVAQQEANASRSQAPRRTGRLAASVAGNATKTEALVQSGLPYANPIHWGWRAHNIEPNQFIVRTVQRDQTRIVDLYAHELSAILADCKGAG